MARKKHDRRARGDGHIVMHGAGYSLVVRVNGRVIRRAIVDATGRRVTAIDAAREIAPALADTIRAEVNRNLAGTPVDRLEETYLRFLPTYSKRKGAPHVDSSGKAPIAPRTLSGNLGCIRAFVRWLQREHPEARMIEALGRPHAAGYLAALGCRPATFNRQLMSLRHAFTVVPVSANPFHGISQKSKAEVDRDATPKRPFTLEELATMQEKAAGWIRPAMFIGYHSGLRLGDVVTLRWSEIDGEGFITKVQRKSSKVQPVYCPEVLPELAAWRRQAGDGVKENLAEFVFPEQADAYLGIGRKVDQTLPEKRFMRFLTKECKFETHDEDGNTVLGFHSLRVSNATYSKRAGASMDDVQKRLAHSDASTTAGYVQTTMDDRRRELRETHRPLLLPGAATEAERSEVMDRDRLAALARTLPIDEVRRLLKGARG